MTSHVCTSQLLRAAQPVRLVRTCRTVRSANLEAAEPGRRDDLYVLPGDESQGEEGLGIFGHSLSHSLVNLACIGIQRALRVSQLGAARGLLYRHVPTCILASATLLFVLTAHSSTCLHTPVRTIVPAQSLGPYKT